MKVQPKKEISHEMHDSFDSYGDESEISGVSDILMNNKFKQLDGAMEYATEVTELLVDDLMVELVGTLNTIEN